MFFVISAASIYTTTIISKSKYVEKVRGLKPNTFPRGVNGNTSVITATSSDVLTDY
jgi:hypothetical protein